MMGSGDPYFISIHKGADPPLYRVCHDVSHKPEVILAGGRRLVSARLSEFFRRAVPGG